MFFLLILPEDMEKIEDIFWQYERPLYYFIQSIVKNHHLAEDALQDTFCKIVRSIERIGKLSATHAKSYIYAIARNAAIDVYNMARQGANTVPLDESRICDDLQDKEAIANARLEILEECLECLSQADREIIALKYELDLSDQQIAELLGISPVAVRQRLFRARKRIIRRKGEVESKIYMGAVTESE